MRRADRLFRIVLELRSDRPVTARTLAERLEVSERTIYRDIQDLSISGIPVLGEPGSGYRLLQGYRLPPLMFDENELEALLLGIRMVETWSDPEMGRAAAQAARKIEAVLPERLLSGLDNKTLLVPPFGLSETVGETLLLLRNAARSQHKIVFHYQRADGANSQRQAHPLGLAYWGRTWTLIAWCELRDDFRSFRLDRMSHIQRTDASFEILNDRSLETFLGQVECTSGKPPEVLR